MFEDYAKELRKVEKSMGVEKVRVIEIYYYTTDKHRCFQNLNEQMLYTAEIPLEMFQRWMWYFEWRKAHYVCQMPRNIIELHTYIKEVKSQTKLDINNVITKYISAKAKVTKYKNIIADMEFERSQTLLPFDQDPLYSKAMNTLKKYETELQIAKINLEAKYKNVFKLT